MPKTISAAEARRRFAEITDEVRMGKESYSIVRHGKEVARLVPPSGNIDPEVDPNLEADMKAFFDQYGDVMEKLAKY